MPRDIHPDLTQIPCTDGFDRARSVGLWTAPSRGRVVLVAPPAETVLLTPAQARSLRDRLGELADQLDGAGGRPASARS
jgi:hypothetical protein